MSNEGNLQSATNKFWWLIFYDHLVLYVCTSLLYDLLKVIFCVFWEPNAYWVRVGKPEGWRTLQRCNHTWNNDIRMDMKEIWWECVDQQRVCMKMVMNLQGRDVANFVTTWRTCSFSRMTALWSCISICLYWTMLCFYSIYIVFLMFLLSFASVCNMFMLWGIIQNLAVAQFPSQFGLNAVGSGCCSFSVTGESVCFWRADVYFSVFRVTVWIQIWILYSLFRCAV